MPQFTWVHSLAAGETFEPLQTWDYERMPLRAVIKILSSATAVGLLQSIRSGSDTLVADAPVPLFGAAGVLPSDQNVEPIIDQVEPGDKIRIIYRNPTAGAVEAHGSIRF